MTIDVDGFGVQKYVFHFTSHSLRIPKENHFFDGWTLDHWTFRCKCELSWFPNHINTFYRAAHVFRFKFYRWKVVGRVVLLCLIRPSCRFTVLNCSRNWHFFAFSWNSSCEKDHWKMVQRIRKLRHAKETTKRAIKCMSHVLRLDKISFSIWILRFYKHTKHNSFPNRNRFLSRSLG